MGVRRESRSEAYDVVVIGSGIGGLAAAALLARDGRRVLVLERHDRVGGYAHGFARGPYRFDAAVHLVGGCQRGIIDQLLRLLGVRDRCEFLRVDPFYSARFPDLTLDVPSDHAGFVEAHRRAFPSELEGVRRLLALAQRVADETHRFPLDPSLAELLATPRRNPTLFRYRNATVETVLRQHLRDPRARAAVSVLWPYLGLPPSRLSFVYWSAMLMSYLEDGASYCRGTWQNLGNALAEGLRRNGGELLLQSPVRTIAVEHGKVAGVRLENGQTISAAHVISNVDALQTFDELIPPAALPDRFRRRLHRFRPALSAFVLFLATDLDVRRPNAGHQMLCAPGWDPEAAYGEMVQGRLGGIGLDVPTLVDPSLAPAGHHIVIATALVPYAVAASWRSEKVRFGESMLAEVERQLPGIREHLQLAEGATPRTMERYTLNLSGSVYGWEASPDQVGPNRLAAQTPIEGLYLAGHWTRPGGGVYAVTLSGIHAAELVRGAPLDVPWRLGTGLAPAPTAK